MHRTTFISLLLVLAVSVPLQGCTLLLPHLVAQSPDEAIPPDWTPSRREAVEIRLSSGQTIRARYLREEPVVDTGYAARFADSLRVHDAAGLLPAPGDTVYIRRDRTGIGERSAVFRAVSDSPETVLYLSFHAGERLVRLDEVTELRRSNRTPISLPSLRAMIESGQLPPESARYMPSLVVEYKGETQHLDPSTVVDMRPQHGPGMSKSTARLLGFAVDVGLLAVSAILFGEMVECAASAGQLCGFDQ